MMLFLSVRIENCVHWLISIRPTQNVGLRVFFTRLNQPRPLVE